MSDELDGLSDEKLSEVFAVEVAGFNASRFAVHVSGTAEYPISAQAMPPPFATDANAVLPFMEAQDEVVIRWFDQRLHIAPREPLYDVEIGGFVRARKERSLARVLCMALIRAARAKAKS